MKTVLSAKQFGLINIESHVNNQAMNTAFLY